MDLQSCNADIDAIKAPVNGMATEAGAIFSSVQKVKYQTSLLFVCLSLKQMLSGHSCG